MTHLQVCGAYLWSQWCFGIVHLSLHTSFLVQFDLFLAGRGNFGTWYVGQSCWGHGHAGGTPASACGGARGRRGGAGTKGQSGDRRSVMSWLCPTVIRHRRTFVPRVAWTHHFVNGEVSIFSRYWLQYRREGWLGHNFAHLPEILWVSPAAH